MAYHRKKVIGLIIFTVLMVMSVPAFAQSHVSIPTERSTVDSNWDISFHPEMGDDYLRELEANNKIGESSTPKAFPTNSLTNGTGDIRLPVGQQVAKIEVAEDGIYEIGYDDLLNAGISISNISPTSIQMLHRGFTVATQFVGDGDDLFESGEMIRFYGESVTNLPRLERQYLNYNVYWLWVNGTQATIQTVANPTGYTPVNNFRSIVTLEEENHWFATWTDKWYLFPNEPDAWFMDRLVKGTQETITGTYAVDLPHVDPTGTDARWTVEVSSRTHTVVSNMPRPHRVEIFLNNASSLSGSQEWYSLRNTNIIATVPASQIVSGFNDVHVVVAGITDGTGKGKSYIYPNRITAEYDRLLVADANELKFGDAVGGDHEFNITGYTETDAGKILAWNITDPLAPVAIELDSADLNAGTLRLASSHTANAQFVATTTNNLLTPVNITNYTPTNITPAGGADWVAISHANFLAQSNQLAQHRSQPAQGSLQTHVVDIEEITNQYGYGLALPEAIRAYLREGLAWDTPIKYVLLVGDANLNPRQIDCQFACMAGFNDHQETFVPTDLAFVDRFQGLIPTDTSIAFLTGDDTILDVAIGRLPVRTSDEAQNIVDKIIHYEQNLLNPSEWMERILYISDNRDSAGDFCNENQLAGERLPETFTQNHFCLPSRASATQIADLRTNLFDQINNEGSLILNYRGHGYPTHWANERIMTRDDASLWQNPDPLIIITADCLDGFFALPGEVNQAMSETLLRLPNAGTAAHWASTGLGYLYEHKVLNDAFHDALFDIGDTRFGDGIRYAFEQYTISGQHSAELYAFNLQGDPAMHLMRPSLSIQSDSPAYAAPNEIVDIQLILNNHGVYPSQSTVYSSLDRSLTYISAESSTPMTVTVHQGEVEMNLAYPLGLADTTIVTLTVQMPNRLTTSSTPTVNTLSNITTINSEAHPGDESIETTITQTSCTPPESPTLSVSADGSDYLLNWTNSPNHYGYEIHQSDTPYFTSSNDTLIKSLGANKMSFSLRNIDISNAVFMVQATGCNAGINANSNTIMFFDFPLITDTTTP